MNTPSEETSLYPFAPDYKNGIPHYRHRALIGWMNDQAALEARASLVEDIQGHHLQVIAAAKAAVQSRNPFVPTNPILEIEENPLLAAIRMRPETYQICAGFADWHFAQVNLREVLTFQPTIRVDNLKVHVPSASMAQEQLYELCFPSSELASPAEVSIELDANGYIVTTLDPNLRIVPWHGVGSPLVSPQQPLLPAGIPFHPNIPPVGAQLLPVVLMKNPGYLQVVRYRGRCFIRDGYHRAAGLLQQQVDIVPCLLLEALHPQQVGNLQPGMLGEEVLFGDHPPRMQDFWEDSVSCDCLYPAKRRIYIISIKEIQALR
jgi:hypothetical protein